MNKWSIAAIINFSHMRDLRQRQSVPT